MCIGVYSLAKIIPLVAQRGSEIVGKSILFQVCIQVGESFSDKIRPENDIFLFHFQIADVFWSIFIRFICLAEQGKNKIQAQQLCHDIQLHHQQPHQSWGNWWYLGMEAPSCLNPLLERFKRGYTQ